MPRSESEYYIKLIPGNDKAVQMTKMVDDEFKDVYVVENTECQCTGAIYHRTQCRHMRIKLVWEQLGRPAHGYFTVSKGGDPQFHTLEAG